MSSKASTAVALSRSPSAVTGLWMPGVSTNTSCRPGLFTMARTWVRVVCGLSETMLTFCPTSAFNSVDLPTFGRPASVTNPERMARGISRWPRRRPARRRPVRRHGRALAGPAIVGTGTPAVLRHMPAGCDRDPDAPDPVAVELLGREAPAVRLDGLPLDGHVAEGAEHEPGDGVPVLVGQLDLEEVVQVADAHPAVDDVRAVGEVQDLPVLTVELVDDLADQLLQAVLQGDHAGDVAVLVQDDGQVELLGLHLAHQPVERLVLGHEPDRPGHGGRRFIPPPVPLGPHQILGVTEADHFVLPRAHHRQPAEAVFDGDVERAADGRVVGDQHHVRPRHHDLAGHGVAELDDGLDELALLAFDDLVLGRGLDDPEQLLLRHERPLLQALAGQDHVREADQRPWR